MSTEIDWSKAPEGATHWDSRGNACSLGFMKPGLRKGEWEYFGCGGHWVLYGMADSKLLEAMMPRSTTWSGEGIPPVGTVCEYKHTDAEEWVKIRVLGYDGEHIWCRALGSERSMVIVSYSALRKSIDEILPDEEERELAIRQMMIDCDNAHARGVLEELYDAGYRKVQGVEK